MSRLADKLADLVVHTGVVPESAHAMYQFGFQIGLEMISCFSVGFAIAFFLHMIPEFLVFMTIFISLRTYAGGLHLEKFWTCFLCSVMVQTVTLLASRIVQFPVWWTWGIIIICSGVIMIISPIENEGHRLDIEEKKYFRVVVIKILLILLGIATVLTVLKVEGYVSLIALTLIVVAISQSIEMWKCGKNGSHD